MKNSDRKAFAVVMAGLAEYYGRPASPELIWLYWDGLKDYEFDEVKTALNQHLRNPDTGQFIPKIADVVKFLEGNTLTQAMRAWQKVDRAVRLVGTYQTVVFDDPLIHAVVSDMGGWRMLGLTLTEEWPFKAREFEKRYQSYRLKAPADYPRKLIGIFEAENAKDGYELPAPVLIGDERAALGVYEGGAEHLRLDAKPMAKLLERQP